MIKCKDIWILKIYPIKYININKFYIENILIFLTVILLNKK